MSVLEYASAFIKLPHFAPAFMEDEKLKMNYFEVGLNPNLKERMSVHQYISCEDIYDTVVNVEKAMKEKNEYCNEQRGNKMEGGPVRKSALSVSTQEVSGELPQ